MALLLKWGANATLGDYITRRLPIDVVGIAAADRASPRAAAPPASENHANARGPTAAAVRHALLQHSPSLRVVVLSHPECQEHRTPSGHQEAPTRIPAILNRLRTAFAAPPLAQAAARPEESQGALVFREDFAKASEESIRAVHLPEYVGFLKQLHTAIISAGSAVAGADGGQEQLLSPRVPLTPAVQRGLMQFKSPHIKSPEHSDTMFTKGSLGASYRAAGAVVAAVDAVLDGTHRRAFCAVRPPGHHAGLRGLPLLSDAVSCGFCVFNNVCVGAVHALRRAAELGDPTPRVAIIDFDVHHGNGTEEIVNRYMTQFNAEQANGQPARQAPLWCGETGGWFCQIVLWSLGRGSVTIRRVLGAGSAPFTSTTPTATLRPSAHPPRDVARRQPKGNRNGTSTPPRLSFVWCLMA